MPARSGFSATNIPAHGANHAGTPCHLPPAWTAEAG
jgi:hypothetical protein